MTTALYRRYRPDKFEDLIGQEHVTHALETALSSSRIAHAYLFSGPRGCGKTTSARILARSLNCANGPTPTPCGTCESCVELASGGPGSLDVVEIDAASHGGVDDARELRERLSFAPSRDRFRVFILDEAHMVSNAGFNALLKAVEEPPPHVKFIFATTEPESVLATIRSRTHHYPFRLVPPTVLIPYLQTICEREGVSVDDTALALVVRAGGGSVRDSLSVLDQLVAGSKGQVTHEQAVRLLGFTDSALLDKVTDALGANDGASVFDLVGELIEAGVDPKQFVEDLLKRIRDLMVCALAGDRAEDILVEVPSDQYAIMQRQAHQWGSQMLSRRADIIEDAVREMAGATAPRLQLELLLARLLVDVPGSVPTGSSGPAPMPPRTQTGAVEPKSVVSAPIPVPASHSNPSRVQETGKPENPVSRPAATPQGSVAPAVVAAPIASVPTEQSRPVAPVNAAPSKDEVRQQWRSLLAILGQSSSMLPSLMQAVRDVEPHGDAVVLSMREQVDVDRFRRSHGEDVLGRALTEIFGRQLRGLVKVIGEPLPVETAPVKPEPVAPHANAEPVSVPNADAASSRPSIPEPSQVKEPEAVTPVGAALVVESRDPFDDLPPEEPPHDSVPNPFDSGFDQDPPDEHHVGEDESSRPELPKAGVGRDAQGDMNVSSDPVVQDSGDSVPQNSAGSGMPAQSSAPESERSSTEPSEKVAQQDDPDARYRGRQPVDLVIDFLGGQVIEETIEGPDSE